MGARLPCEAVNQSGQSGHQAAFRERMTAPLNIHPELRSIKAHRMPLNRWVLAAMQNLLSAVNAIHRRKFKPFITRTTIIASDNYSLSRF